MENLSESFIYLHMRDVPFCVIFVLMKRMTGRNTKKFFVSKVIFNLPARLYKSCILAVKLNLLPLYSFRSRFLSQGILLGFKYENIKTTH